MRKILWVILVFGFFSSSVAIDEDNEISDAESVIEAPAEAPASQGESLTLDENVTTTGDDNAVGASATALQIETSNSIVEPEIEGQPTEDESSVEALFRRIIKKVPKKLHRFSDYSSEESKERNKFEKKIKEFRKQNILNVQKKQLSTFNPDVSFRPKTQLETTFPYEGIRQTRGRRRQPIYFG